MKLTDRARGFLLNLAAASRGTVQKATHREYWRAAGMRTSAYWRSEWALASPVRVYLATAVATAFLITASASAIGHMNQTQAWTRVYTNGSYVGMVPNDPEVLSEMHRIAIGYDVSLQLTPLHTSVNPSYDWQTVAGLPTKAVAIQVDGKPVVYTQTKTVAQDVLTDLQRALIPPHLSKGATVQFSGNIAIVPAMVSVTEVLDPTAAFRYLLRPALGAVSGRSEGFVGLPIDLVKNPIQLTSAKPQPGPVISVETVQTITRNVSIGYPIQFRTNNQLGLGTEKIIQNGMLGVEREQVKQTYVNGHLKTQQVLSKVVVKPARPEIAERGTNAGVASGGWVWPTNSYLVTSPFGWRILGGYPNFHPGIDLGCPIGTPIYATNNGVVEDAGWNSGGYGIWALINNGSGIETVFGHMSQVLVHAGQTVAKGQIIGYSGETGWATGPHLHYEVRQNGVAIPPGPYM